MALRNLSPRTMAAISAHWLDPEEDLPVLQSLPVVKALIPVIEDRHGGIVNTQNLGALFDKHLVEVKSKQKGKDKRHDRKIRGTHSILNGLADVTDDPVLAAKLVETRDRLLPEGLEATQRSYLDQAGDARRIEGRLDSEIWSLLGQARTFDGTLADCVKDWVATALELETLEYERADLEGGRKAKGSGASRQDERDAMFAWIRMANTLAMNLEVDPKATDDIRDRILGPLHRAEAKADRRAAAGNKSIDDDDIDSIFHPGDSDSESPASDTGADDADTMSAEATGHTTA